VIEDKDVAQWEEWTDLEHLPQNTTRVRSVRLAAGEEREQQAGLRQRFAKNVLSESGSDSPRVSASEDSDGVCIYSVYKPESEPVLPEWMPEADVHMLNIEGSQPVPWEQDEVLVAQRGEVETPPWSLESSSKVGLRSAQ
jgi:hypothetical protein